jgi:hypothetical protein
MTIHRWVGAVLVGSAAVTLSLGQGAGSSPPAYDVKSEVVVHGKVAAVTVQPDWMGKNGVNVSLQTPEAVMIHVDTAPAEFLRMLDFAIANGDELAVTGVWSHWDGNRVFLARIVTRQRMAVMFRDPEGKPVW